MIQLLLFVSLFAATLAGNFTIGQDTYLLNGEPIQLFSAAFHYFRVHPDRWEDTFKKLANAGINTVETYIAWNMHEPEQGDYRFDGANDLDNYLRLAEKYGFLVIVRPGPYICAEWEFGGLPYWLLKEDDIQIRTKDRKYMDPVAKWFSVLFPVLAPHMVTNGGSIIMVQIENEYGSYPACDKEYLNELYELTVKYLGPTTGYVTFTTDGPSDGMVTCGRLAGLAYSTVDFGPGDAHASLAVMRKYEPNGPLQNSEFYPGWLDHWSEKHQTTAIQPILDTMQEMYDMKASWNFYVFIGGTNWGFMSGANGGGATLQPQPTSYDYDAPLSEAGDMTDKYWAIREKIGEWKKLPEYEVHDTEKASYGEIQFSETASLWENVEMLDKEPVKAEHPITMEKLGLDYGFILYRTSIGKSGKLHLDNVHDRAYIYVNDQYMGLIERKDCSVRVDIKAEEGDVLNVLVENMGRLNYGGQMTDPKGILGDVYIDNEVLTNWEMFRLGMKDLSDLKWREAEGKAEGPAFYRSFVKIDKVADTFINPKGWTKGHIYINGFNIGRYWTVGPQLTLYVPSPLLKEGTNEIISFEIVGSESLKMSLDDVHQIDIDVYYCLIEMALCIVMKQLTVMYFRTEY